MINKNIFSIALVIICLSIPAANLNAQSKIRTRSSLKKENLKLKHKLDSLKKENAKLTKALEGAVNGENEDTISLTAPIGIAPEDYTTEVSDSLLTIWYTQKRFEEDEVEEVDMDSVRFESNVPDSVYIQRLKAMNSFINLPYNDIVRNYIILYSEKRAQGTAKILGIGEHYMTIFEEILLKHDMPQELKVMAIIESALNPTAVSWAGAKGMWQFMYQTAKMYNLTVDSFVDERLDPIKSADAAARFLKDLYAIFGDWNLAIAAYNCGPGNVNKAIRRCGGSRAFWDIYPFLPRETRGYVPAFVGALYAVNYYKEHGIVPIPADLPAHVDTFRINKMLHFKQINELVGVPMDDIKTLNPQYKHGIIPGTSQEYILRLPFEYTNAFIDNEDSIYTYKKEEFFNPLEIKKIKEGGDGTRIVYRVRSGDYLGKIANRYRVSVNNIKRWNNLRSNNIRVGQRLVIYPRGSVPKETTSSDTNTKETIPTTNKNFTGHSLYTVKSGDSLYLIAKNYPGISANDIMAYNKIGSKIKPGMVIKIPQL